MTPRVRREFPSEYYIDELAYHSWTPRDTEHAIPANHATADETLALYAYAEAAASLGAKLFRDSNRIQGLERLRSAAKRVLALSLWQFA
jgi:hypothetical protein